MNWDDAGTKIKKGPMSTLKLVLTWIVILMIAVAGLNVIGGTLGWIGEAQQVAREELGPRAMLKKYEWFKDASATLDAKKQAIIVMESRALALRDDYNGVPRTEWDRVDKQSMNMWSQELAGTILSYNNMSAEWNAQISKFNWKPFLTSLPSDAETTLTKYYSIYITQ